MSPLPRTRLAIAASVTAALMLSGCGALGGTPDDPAVAFSEAVAELGSGKRLSITLDADASAKDFAKALPKRDNKAQSLVWSDTTVKIDMQAHDRDLIEEADPMKVDSALVADVGGEAPITISLFEGKGGMKVDVRDLTEIKQGSPVDPAAFRESARNTTPEWREDFLKGRWLELSPDGLSRVTSSHPITRWGYSPSTQNPLKSHTAYLDAIAKNSKATFGKDGDDGQEVDLALNVEPFLKQMESTGGVWKGASKGKPFAKTITVKAWVSRGDLSKVQFRMNDFMRLIGMDSPSSAKGGLPGNLVISFDSSAQVEQPVNPTALANKDVKAMLGGIPLVR